MEQLREKAYYDVIKEHQLEPFVINKKIDHGQEDTVIDELLAKNQRFDGVFVSGCILANAMYNKINSLGLKMPEDIQMISYDGEFAYDDIARITTLEQPLKLMAEKCVESLIKLINKEEGIELLSKFDCRLIKGHTTK